MAEKNLRKEVHLRNVKLSMIRILQMIRRIQAKPCPDQSENFVTK